MGKIFAVTSGKGGVGKSTLSAGLAGAFAGADKSVLLADMDEGLRCLDLMLGVSEELVFDIGDVLMGKPLEDAVCHVRGFKRLDLLAAPNDTGRTDAFSFAAFAAEAARIYDIVIFDFPAGVDFRLCAALPDQAVQLVVVNPDAVCIRDAAAVCNRLEEFASDVRMIINRFDVRLVKSGVYRGIDEAIDRSGIQLIGVVPYSEDIAAAAAAGRLVKKGRAKKAFTRIARRLCGEQVRLPRISRI